MKTLKRLLPLFLALLVSSVASGQAVSVQFPFYTPKIGEGSKSMAIKAGADYELLRVSRHMVFDPGISFSFIRPKEDLKYPDHAFSETSVEIPLLFRYSYPIFSARQFSIFAYAGPELVYSISRSVKFWRMNEAGVKINSQYDYFKSYEDSFFDSYHNENYDNMRVLDALRGLPQQSRFDIRAIIGAGVTMADSFDVFAQYSYGFMDCSSTINTQEKARFVSVGVRFNIAGLNRYLKKDF